MVEVVDTDIKSGFISSFQYALKCYRYFYHVAFLETCKYMKICPQGLQLEKKPFIGFIDKELSVMWESTLRSTEESLLEALCLGISQNLFKMETSFWKDLEELESKTKHEDICNWWVKLLMYLEKEEKRLIKKKKKKLRKFYNLDMSEASKAALERFDEHLSCFDFKSDIMQHSEHFSTDIHNIVNLCSLENEPDSSVNSSNLTDNDNISVLNNDDTNEVEHENERLKGHFVSKNVCNISKRTLTDAEISLLSKGLKFVPTSNSVNRAVLKEELEAFGRRLRFWFKRVDDCTIFIISKVPF